MVTVCPRASRARPMAIKGCRSPNEPVVVRSIRFAMDYFKIIDCAWFCLGGNSFFENEVSGQAASPCCPAPAGEGSGAQALPGLFTRGSAGPGHDLEWNL